MTDPDNRIGPLYRATRQETPPAHLDRAILSAARSAARRRRLRWILPASSAALVLLGLSLSYRFLEDLAGLEAPEAVAPARLGEERAPGLSGAPIPKTSPESTAERAQAPEKAERLRQPARSPAPGGTLGLPSAADTRRAATTQPKAQLRSQVAEPAVSSPTESEELAPAPLPDAWLRQARAFKEGGDLEAARQLLRKVLQQFPDAEIPPDLRDLLAGP